MHRHRPVTVIRSVSTTAIFAGCAGVFAQASQPVAATAPPPAPPPSVQIVNMGGMAPGKIGPVVAEVGTLCTRTLVTAANSATGVQVGTVAKHTHAYPDEVQYMMSGAATAWFDNAPYEARVGDLIVAPRGVVYGTLIISADFKSVAIKLPPQRVGDIHRAP